MATVVTKGISRILENRRFDDYKSMKQAFKYSGIKEIIFEGYQLMTNSPAALEPGDLTIVLISPQAVVFLSTLGDDSNQDGRKVWIVYQDNTGEIHTILTKLDNDNSTQDEVPLGCEAVVTTVADVTNDTIQLTGIDSAILDEFKGMYVVGCGDATDQPGAVLLITGSSIATPSVLDISTTPDGNWAGDNVSLQSYTATNFYRLREMYCEVEVLEDYTIRLGNATSGAYYGMISRGSRYMSSSRFFTQPATVCRSFIGRIKATSSTESTDAKKQGNEVQITFTPKGNTDGGVADITINLVFDTKLDWQPCIELAPATDVSIKILALDATNVDDMHVEVTYLEVYDVNKQKI